MLKKVLASISAITMAAVLCSVSALAASPGDVDNSGAVDIEDAAIILNHINGVKKLDDAAMKAADVDSNDAVDIEDVVSIINQINGVRVIINNSATLKGLDKQLREKGVVSTEAKTLDPSYYHSMGAVEYPGECTIVLFDKASEGYTLAASGKLTAPDGSHIGFQGFCQTDDVMFAYSYDYSDYSGSHGVEWQKSLGKAIWDYCYS